MAACKGLFSTCEDRLESELDTTCEWPASGWRLTSTTLRATREHDELTASIERGSKGSSPQNKLHTTLVGIYCNNSKIVREYTGDGAMGQKDQKKFFLIQISV